MGKLIAVLSVICVVFVQLNATPVVRVNRPWVYGDNFQGDIKLTQEQRDVYEGKAPRTGWTWLPFRWPKNANGHVVVPFQIAANAGFSEFKCISSSLKSLHEHSFFSSSTT